MDVCLIFCLLILITMIFLFINNYKLLIIKQENFKNNFTNDKDCCSHNAINECNKYGKTCVCDYFKKNSYFCENSY